MRANQASAEPIEWRGIHHVAMVTADLDATRRFYADLLGMTAGPVYPAFGRRGRHCFIRPGNTKSWGIHFFEYPDAEIFQSREAIARLARNREAEDLYRFLPGAMQHIAFALPSEADTSALRCKLRNHGILMTEIYEIGSIRNFVFLDNNGIQLEAAWPKDPVQV